MRINLILFSFLLICSQAFFAQERVTTFGVQFKPIIPSELFNTGKQEIVQNNIAFSVTPQTGYSFGMVIRRGLTKNLSIESGINYLKRNLELSINDKGGNFQEKSKYRLISYEIPISLMVYIRLSDYLFMNVSGGLAFDIYPSDLYTYSQNFRNDVLMYNWARPSLIANLGWEYRTEKSGYFYFGASYHRPFGYMAREELYYNRHNRNELVKFDLSGNYITIDFRYFFHEDAEKKKKKVKKSKPSLEKKK